MWWMQSGSKLERATNLTVINVPIDTSRALAQLTQRNMQLHCTIEDEQIWLADKNNTVQVELAKIKIPAHPFHPKKI